MKVICTQSAYFHIKMPTKTWDCIQNLPSTIVDTTTDNMCSTRLMAVHTGAILLSEKMTHAVLNVETIGIDVAFTFFTCPKQFVQLWTVF